MPAIATEYKDDAAYNEDAIGDERFKPENQVSGYPQTVDPADRFTYGVNAAAARQGPGQFSLIVEGFIKWNTSTTYNIRVRAVDGLRLWINGVLIIDNWAEVAVVGTPEQGDWNDIASGTHNDVTTGTKTAGTKETFKLEWYGHLDDATDENWIALGIKRAADTYYTYWEDASGIEVLTS